MSVLLVMVLNLGVCIIFLTKDFVDINVLIFGLNFSFLADFLKSFLYSGSLIDVRIVEQRDLWWLVG